MREELVKRSDDFPPDPPRFAPPCVSMGALRPEKETAQADGCKDTHVGNSGHRVQCRADLLALALGYVPFRVEAHDDRTLPVLVEPIEQQGRRVWYGPRHPFFGVILSDIVRKFVTANVCKNALLVFDLL